MRAYHLQVLGLNEGANDIEIKASYRRLSKLYHPDINAEAGARDRFLQIKEAYEYLSQTPHLHEAASQYTYQEEVLSDREIWKRDYLKKKRAEELEAKKRRAAIIRKCNRICSPVILLALIFNALLVFDYILPLSSKEEPLLVMKVKKYGSPRSRFSRRGAGSKDNTSHLILRFPSFSTRASLKDGNHFVKDDMYLIEATPILSIPRYMTNLDQRKRETIQPNFGIYRMYGFLIPATLILSILFFKYFSPINKFNVIILILFFFSMQLLLFFV